MKRRIILTATVIACTLCVQATQVVEYNDPTKSIMIGQYIDILEDHENNLTFTQVTKSDQFKRSDSKVPNLGVTSSSFWIKFKLKNNTNEDGLLLELGQPLMDEVEFYEIKDDGSFRTEIVGEHLEFSKREFNYPNYLFSCNISPGDEKTYILKVKSNEQILIPLKVGTHDIIKDSLRNKDLIFGIYLGIILVMFFYNLFLYLTVKDKSYLYYVGYILLVGLTQITVQGYSFQYLWPDTPWLATHSIFLIAASVGIFTILFLQNFLHTSTNTPKLNKGLNILMGVYGVCIGLALAGVYDVSYNLINMTAGILSFYIIGVTYTIMKQGYRPAKFFLLAWSIFVVGVFIFVMKDFGILPYNDFTVYTMTIGSAIEVTLLSFALADRINILKQEKEESQEEVLQVKTQKNQ
ncbi:MAG: hypothetical protein IH946_12835 [Bacteroidetes bacterium]|nr:hypothetical protein [Bacteroidota bacterium]